MNRLMSEKMDTRGSNTVVVTISPAEATELLKGNVGNRPLNRRTVLAMSECMRRGEWRLTHQGIALAPDMRLLDGQHRLAAIVQSGVSIAMSVTYDLDPAAFAFIDRGRIRPISYALNASEQEVAVTRLALGVMSGKRPTPSTFSVGQVAEALPLFGPHVQKFKNSCPTIRRTRSSAPVVLAFLALKLAGDREQYNYDLFYRNFVLLEYEDMPRSALALLRQIDDGRASASRPYDMLVRVWVAFSPASRSLTKIQVTNVEGQLEKIQAVLVRAYEAPWLAP